MSADPAGLTRRDFVRLGASAAALCAAGGWRLPALGAGPAKWGLQLYTLRNQMRDKPGETLKAVAAIGYREVEMLHQTLERDMPLVKAAGLEAPSMHIPASIVTGDWSLARKAAARGGWPAPNEAYGVDALVADAKRHGIQHLIVAYIPDEERTLEFYKRFVDGMNRAGEKCKAAGLRLGYHNHAFEFETVGDIVPMTYMLERFDPALVTLEMDVFWWSMAGRDPVKDIRALGKKVTLLHLKDRSKGSEDAAPGKPVPAGAFAEVGSGMLDFKAILAAGQEAGVQHAFVEQDQTPGEPLVSIKKSYEYLSSLKL